MESRSKCNSTTESSFEVIPSVITVVSNPKRSKEITSVQASRNDKIRDGSPFPRSPSSKRRRVESKMSSSSKTKMLLGRITITALVLLGAACAHTLLSTRYASPSHGTIEDLRGEFKEDLEILRSEIQQELEANLLAAVTVQTAANERATELRAEQDHKRGLGANTNTNTNTNMDIHTNTGQAREGIDVLSSVTMTSKINIESPPTDGDDSQKDDTDVRYMVRIQTSYLWYKIVMITSYWGQNLFLRMLQNMTVATKWAKTTIFHQLQNIRVATDWLKTGIVVQLLQTIDFAKIASLYWIQDTVLHRGLDFANRNLVEVGIWLTAVLFLLYNCYSYVYRQGLDQLRDCGTSIVSKDHCSSYQNGDVRGSDNYSEVSLVDDNYDIDGDAIMEHMFHESMVVARNSPVVPRTVKSNKQTRDNLPCTDTVSTITKSFIPILSPKTLISNEEQRRRARINGHKSAEGDKFMLLNGYKTAHPTSRYSFSKEERRSRARAYALEFAERDKRRLSGGQPKTPFTSSSNVSSPAGTSSRRTPALASKRVRLEQARENAMLYAEQDKQRRQKAAIENHWNKYR